MRTLDERGVARVLRGFAAICGVALALVGAWRPASAQDAPAVSATPTPTPVTIERPAEGSVTFLKHIKVSGRAPDPSTLVVSINGVAVGTGVTGMRVVGQYEFVNIPVEPGPQRITVAATSGGVTSQAAVSIHVQGPPAKLEIEGDLRAPADPTVVSTYRVRVLDRWGKPVPDGYFVTVSAEKGVLDTPDGNPSMPGVQVRVVDGAGEVKVRASNNTGFGLVRAAAGDLVAERGVSYYAPPRPLMMVGRVGAAVGVGTSHSSLGWPSEPGPGLSTDGRLRMFLRGSTQNGYLLTGALDSRHDLEDRLFKEMDPNQMQPVFGDTSSVFYEGQSRDRLFLQLERGADVYRYGDFTTGFSPGGFGAYERALTGVRIQQSTPLGPVVFFGAQTSQSAERTEIRANGTSGYYFLPGAPVVAGSERVWIETRDRDRPQVVLSSEYRARLIDYDIDYQQGSIFFRQPVPGIDARQNPVFIVAVYESRAPGARKTITGLRGDTRLGAVGVGTTLVREERSGRNYTLGSVDLSVKLPYGASLLTEAASSQAQESGSAWRAELQAAPNPRTKLRAFVRTATQGFENPSTPQFLIGSRTQGLDLAYDIDPQSGFLAQWYRQSGSGSKMTTANGRYRRSFRRLGTEVELLHQSFSGGGTSGSRGSTLLSGLAKYPLWGRLDLIAQREQALSGSNPLRPNGTTVGADLRITPKVRIEAREKLTDSGFSIASIGVASEFLKGTSLTSTYEINSVNNGGYNQASIGLNTVVGVTRYVTSNLAYEQVRVFGPTPGYQSASVGFEYKPDFPFVGTLKLEGRRSAGKLQTSIAMGASGRVTRDVAVLFRHTHFADGGTPGALVGATGVPTWRTSLGLAYRPAGDHLNLLARYQTREDSSGLAGTDQASALTRIQVASLEGVYQPEARWHLTGKYAFRVASTDTEGVRTRTYTDLWLARGTYDLDPDWNVSGEVRRLHQRETDTEEFGYSVEVGRVLRSDLAVGLGYNFAGENDPDLAGGSLWARGPYVRFGWKFDEDDARSWLTKEGVIRMPRLSLGKWGLPAESGRFTVLGNPSWVWDLAGSGAWTETPRAGNGGMRR